ncbi:MAG: Hcp family type VI secretion system effector [Desulfobulbaceae bacterium]|nr:Hcp family type VI secretion system effector [Desulfobulbaceae bacterium]
MPSPAYMTVTGERQGNITAGTFTEASVGNNWQQGHEDEALVQSFDHTIMLPRDPQTGQPTGQRVHKPFSVVKVFDKCSPLLFSALTSGEKLSKVELKFYRTAAQGNQEHYYTILLEDAIIVDIQNWMPHCQDPSAAHLTHMEKVDFTYRKITKTHEVASTSESDDWRTATGA